MEIEVLLLRPLGTGLAYRALRMPLEGATPDDSALALSGAATFGSVCHSTSWRHVAPSTLVLTYAALPDPEPALPAVPLRSPAVLSSGDALRPGPADLHEHHVVAHAVRHLAMLSREDPTIAATVARDRALWAAVRRTAAGLRTGTHDELLAGPHAHAVAPPVRDCDDGLAAPA